VQPFLGQIPAKARDPSDVKFGLSPTGSNKSHVQIRNIPGIGKVERSDGCAFTRLPWPANSKKLILPISLNNVNYIPVGLKLAELLKKKQRVSGYFAHGCLLLCRR
jgi:hypothetical protein